MKQIFYTYVIKKKISQMSETFTTIDQVEQAIEEALTKRHSVGKDGQPTSYRLNQLYKALSDIKSNNKTTITTTLKHVYRKRASRCSECH